MVLFNTQCSFIAILITIISCKYTQQQFSDAPLVRTSKGFVRGKSQVIKSGQSVNLFSGIPFAQPPIDSLRWTPPQPVPSWAPDIRSAEQYGASCPQEADPLEKPMATSEDCLYLNVITPNRVQSNQQSLLPVLFIIHGGSFETGAGRSYESEKLAESLASSDVVVVTTNYRLGALGFMVFESNRQLDDGNYGVLDMVAALKWVQTEIRQFGGDPNRVTIYGESAGSMAVSLLTLMEGVNELFSQVIQQSNSILTEDLVLSESGFGVLTSKVIIYKAGCGERTDLSSLMQCMRALPYKTIIELQNSAKPDDRNIQMSLPWQPLVRATVVLQSALRNRRKIKAIYIVNKHEGGLWFIEDLMNPFALASYSYGRKIVEDYLKASFEMNGVEFIGRLKQEADQNYRVDDVGILQRMNPLTWMNKSIDVFTDSLFAAPQWVDAKQMAENNPNSVYLLSFDHVPENFLSGLAWSGTVHALDVEYILGDPGYMFEYKPTSDDYYVANAYSEIVSNFVKYGNPTPPGQSNLPMWTAIQSSSRGASTNYMSLTTQPTMMNDFYPIARNFWAGRVMKEY